MDNCKSRNSFTFNVSQQKLIHFNSQFDSGNLYTVQLITDTHFLIKTAIDCQGTENEGFYSSWFYFSVTGFSYKTKFTIHRMQILFSLLKSPSLYRPVFRVNQGGCLEVRSDNKYNEMEQISMSFQYKFENDEDVIYFAFTYPYSYDEMETYVYQKEKLWAEHQNIYFNRQIIIRSPQKRNIHQITISNHQGKLTPESYIEHLYPDKQQTHFKKFRSNKPIILLTGRVHPIQTPGSYCIKGIIDFLLNTQDARAYFLRKYFVFIIIPMLNPDGVSRGHCRMDIFNQNLNRFYKNPNIYTSPSCYAIKQLVQYLQNDKKIFFYCDFHAHPCNKGNFFFGNAIDKFVLQVQSVTFPKVLSKNCSNFQFEHCKYSRKHMKFKDVNQDMTKEGCGRQIKYNKSSYI